MSVAGVARWPRRLRGHELRRALERVGLVEARGDAAAHRREAEVGDGRRAVGAQQDIGRLDFTSRVRYAARVQRLEPGEHAVEHARRILGRDGALLQPLAQQPNGCRGPGMLEGWAYPSAAVLGPRLFGRRKPPMSRALLGFALLATALAGCTAPAAEHPSPSFSSHGPQAHPAAGAAATSTAFPGANLEPCLPTERRTEEAQLHTTFIRVEGCLAAAVVAVPFGERTLRVGRAVGGPEVAFEVAPDARSLVAQVHLHGPEELSARIVSPAGRATSESAKGTDNSESYVRFELQAPGAGTWELQGELEQLALARPWTAVIVIDYVG